MIARERERLCVYLRKSERDFNERVLEIVTEKELMCTEIFSTRSYLLACHITSPFNIRLGCFRH